MKTVFRNSDTEQQSLNETLNERMTETLNATVIMVIAFMVCWTPYYLMALVRVRVYITG